MTDAFVAGRRVRLDPSRSIGKGGEADVFDIGGGLALKLYKPPDHPDYRGLPDEQRAARERLRTRQRKLRDFPRALPDRVVAPLDLATDRSGAAVVGYTMRLIPAAEALLSYADPAFRARGVPSAAVPTILLDLHDTVARLHEAGVVIGDFNDLNVLVAGAQAHLIDADSFQFGAYACTVFTERFVDPLLCGANALQPCRPFSPLSDWYAFAVMAMQCLLLVGPYGGVHRGRPAVPPGARPLRRITVFHPDVLYPKPAIPWRVLPDELLQHFHLVFERDHRDVFPRGLLDGLRWTRCTACGTEHARPLCPGCSHAAPAAIRAATTARGAVTATRILRTEGIILEAGPGRWLVHESGEFRREDGSVVLRGDVRPDLAFRLMPRATLIGRGGRLVTVGERAGVMSADAFDANDRFRYWSAGGRLLRDGPFGPELIGDVLAGQTRFWVGPDFGFGFYRAGSLSVAFVFDAERRGIRDGVGLPPIGGRLVDARCVFGADRAWALFETDKAARCAVVRRDGTVEAVLDDVPAGWRGACAAGRFLFVPTDEGIVRLEPGQRREFPDTEPFVDASSRLVAGRDGLVVANRQEILVLKIS